MKKRILKSLGLLMVIGTLGACQTTLPPTQYSTIGLLICEANELCPVVSVSWNDQAQDVVGIKVSLDSIQQNYDIQKISFSNGSQQFIYMPTEKTVNSIFFGMHRSQNNFNLPKSMILDLKGEQVSMSVHTDQGTLLRYIYKDGKESLIYQQLKSIHTKN